MAGPRLTIGPGMRRLTQFLGPPEERWEMLRGTSPLYFLFPNIQFSFSYGTVSLIKIYPDPDDASRLSAIRETPEAWAAIRFAISDAHFEARTQAGVDP